MLKHIGRSARPSSTKTISLDFSDEMRKFHAAVSPKVFNKAVATAFKRVAGTVITNKRSVAAKAAFGSQGRYAISMSKAMDKGAWKAYPRSISEKEGQVILLATIRGKSIGLHHFKTYKPRMVKVPIGPTQYLAKRSVLRVRVLRQGKQEVARPWRGKNVGKRWSAKYPAEFGGFFASANKGSSGGGAQLIFMRKRAPRGGKGARQHDRYPLVSMYTMPLSDFMINTKVWPKLELAFSKELPKQIAARFDYYMNVAARSAR